MPTESHIGLPSDFPMEILRERLLPRTTFQPVLKVENPEEDKKSDKEDSESEKGSVKDDKEESDSESSEPKVEPLLPKVEPKVEVVQPATTTKKTINRRK